MTCKFWRATLFTSFLFIIYLGPSEETFKLLSELLRTNSVHHEHAGVKILLSEIVVRLAGLVRSSLTSYNQHRDALNAGVSSAAFSANSLDTLVALLEVVNQFNLVIKHHMLVVSDITIQPTTCWLCTSSIGCGSFFCISAAFRADYARGSRGKIASNSLAICQQVAIHCMHILVPSIAQMTITTRREIEDRVNRNYWS